MLLCPNDSRNEPRALAGSAPIAISTCDGCATPAVQADPVEHSIPLASKSISNASPSEPRKVKCALPGSRSRSRAPLRRTSSISLSTPSTRRSRSIRSRAALVSRPSTAIRAAVAIPTAPATYGVPERMSRSCPPPCNNGIQVTSRRSSNAPTPGGPPNLCAATLIAESPLAANSTGSWPTACTASLCMGTPNSAAIAASSAIGMMVPTSLLAHITDTSATSSWLSSTSRSADADTEPSGAVGSQVTSAPSCSTSQCTESSTAWCSTSVVTMRRRLWSASRRAQ
jgi:hypothetical protein